ncbi:hypothetical protein BU23DRAFT_252192 [Bimuria novae-zelandiae CBS 107.79]|uniref:Uncharacterized protein n=1 Tax=Bimuria novae-zelandiae CBS 107.79 TaxID=1447943 RepID=A0A6A5VNQ8_9PLEO|nr:hypothetical protein BU23DRAFT_252192 [Bimuria novae-zelandiae CBS 107.79]
MFYGSPRTPARAKQGGVSASRPPRMGHANADGPNSCSPTCSLLQDPHFNTFVPTHLYQQGARQNCHGQRSSPPSCWAQRVGRYCLYCVDMLYSCLTSIVSLVLLAAVNKSSQP